VNVLVILENLSTFQLIGLRRRADSKITWTVVREDGSEEIASIVFEYHSVSMTYATRDSPAGQEEGAGKEGEGGEVDGVEKEGLRYISGDLERQAQQGLNGTCACGEGEQCHMILW
jgi:hypothetical protein